MTTYTHNENIEEAVQTGPLELGPTTVHHQLRVSSGKHNEAVTPSRIFEATSTQQHAVVVQRKSLPLVVEPSLESVEPVVGRFADDLS